MTFKSIADNSVYKGILPTKVDLPYHYDKPIKKSVIKTFQTGDEGWGDALIRFMFLKGYTLVDS